MWASILSIGWSVIRPIWVLVLPYVGPSIEWATISLGPVGLVFKSLSPMFRILVFAAAIIVPLLLISRHWTSEDPKLVPISEVQLEAKEAELRELREAQAVAEETLRLRESQAISLERTLTETKRRLEVLRAQVPDADRPAVLADDAWMRAQ